VSWSIGFDTNWQAFNPKFDHPRWLAHKATDYSWAEWRKAEKKSNADANQSVASSI
jgi:hypothetical protein